MLPSDFSCTYCGCSEHRHAEWCVHTQGRFYADEIIRRRLEQCLNDGVGHTVFEEPKYTCRRCGIKRLFHVDTEYIQNFQGYTILVTRRVTLL